MLGFWLVEGAAQLADPARCRTRHEGVDPGSRGSTKFYARRFAHETIIHRADATFAVGAEFTVDQEIAVDAIDEWMELGSLPMHFEILPWMRELLGAGRTLPFHATDTARETAAEWLIDLTGDAIVWRRAHGKAAVAVRGPLIDLLLVILSDAPPATKTSRSSAMGSYSTSGWSGLASDDWRGRACRPSQECRADIASQLSHGTVQS